jgi:hypothetical protein
MDIGIPKETKRHEYRVAATPSAVRTLIAAGHDVRVQAGAGDGSGFPDGDYRSVGARIVPDAAAAWAASLVLKVKEPVPSEYGYLRDDLILFHNLVEPEYFVPVHGEYRHLTAHREVAIATGIVPENVLICEDGDTVVLEDGVARKGDQIRAGMVFIDGLLPDVGPAVLRDRVASPGGTTIEGLAALEENGVRHALIEAVRAARDRAGELGKA